jgi:hypothetical protein
MTAQQTANSPGRRGITFISNPVLSIILSVLLTIALKLLIVRGWPHLLGFWDVLWLRTIRTVAVAGFGVALFQFRKYNQFLYGGSEVGFALALSWISIERAQTARDAASLIAVVAAAYFMVRGLTNCQEGKKKWLPKNKF